MQQQQLNNLHPHIQPSTAEAALISSCVDGTEKYQKISEIGKGKHETYITFETLACMELSNFLCKMLRV